MKILDTDIYILLVQVFRSLSRVLQWYEKYVWNFTTFDPMYVSSIYSIYKVTIDDGYDH